MMVQPFDRAKVPMVGLMSSLKCCCATGPARTEAQSHDRRAAPKCERECPAKFDQSSASLKLSDKQRGNKSSLIAGLAAPPRVTDQPFTVSVGAAVPHQVPLKQIPTDLASAFNGFQGDDYVLVETSS